MKRDIRLHGLSSDHHHALLLARSLGRAAEAWTAKAAKELGRRFQQELEPHFAIEEELLLKGLVISGQHALVERIMDEHARLRREAALASAGRGDAAAALGRLLEQHVRFEERTLLPACEELLPAAVLDQVAQRSVKEKKPCS